MENENEVEYLKNMAKNQGEEKVTLGQLKAKKEK